MEYHVEVLTPGPHYSIKVMYIANMWDSQMFPFPDPHLPAETNG